MARRDGKDARVNVHGAGTQGKEGDTNHAVLYGRNDDGARFMYNPGGDPSYVTENPSDPASVERFDNLSKALMGKLMKAQTQAFKDQDVDKGDYYAWVKKYS